MPTSKKKAQAESKKAEQKKKNKIIEDKTFGLKNKNKSKKVQAFINATTKSVMHGGDPKKRREEELRKKRNAERKALKKAQEDERNALFGEALMAVKKKTTTKTKGGSEAKGRDHDDKKEKGGTSKAMKMMFQMDATEMEEALMADVSKPKIEPGRINQSINYRFMFYTLVFLFFNTDTYLKSNYTSIITILDFSFRSQITYEQLKTK